MFQFPSNGKAHSDKSILSAHTGEELVSIPFKREGSFRHRNSVFQHPLSLVFQFPSNGKAHSDSEPMVGSRVVRLFQFPSNGKAHSDSEPMVGSRVVRLFQFPSNGKAHSDKVLKRRKETLSSRFNSLQTGRLIQTDGVTEVKMTAEVVFQFPSNGKAHSDQESAHSWGKILSCFNSLQTGRLIQTLPTTVSCLFTLPCFNSLQTGRLIQTIGSLIVTPEVLSFNSLQTGRLIQTLNRKRPNPSSVVSIPFKREGSFRLKIAIAIFISCVMMFQFPSNGKAHSDETVVDNSVSASYAFQFPSNGKAHSDTARKNLLF